MDRVRSVWASYMVWVSQQLHTNKTIHRGYGGGREEGSRGVKEGRGTAQLGTMRLKGMRAYKDTGGDPASVLTRHLHSDLCCRRKGLGAFFLIQGTSSYSLMKILLRSLASLISLRWGDVHPFFRIPNWVVKFSRGTDRGQQQTNQLRESSFSFLLL